MLQRRGREVVSTHLIDRGCGQGGVDFLLQRTALARAIVTNPPFNRAEAFLRHAAKLGVEYVAFLHKAHWLNAAERGSLVETVWCPARCYLLQWRPDFKNQGSPTMDCNWYVFTEGAQLDIVCSVAADQSAAAARIIGAAHTLSPNPAPGPGKKRTWASLRR